MISTEVQKIDHYEEEKKKKYEVLYLIGRYRGWIPAIFIPVKSIKNRTRDKDVVKQR